MVGEEGPPGLRRTGTPLRHEPGDGALGDVDAELQEFAMDARGAPQRVGGGDSGDPGPDLGVDGRATSSRSARKLVQYARKPTPPQDGDGGHDDEGLRPAQIRTRPTQNRRSVPRNRGRVIIRL